MTFSVALEYLKKGKKVRRDIWDKVLGSLKPSYICMTDETLRLFEQGTDGSILSRSINLTWQDLSAMDWEVVE